MSERDALIDATSPPGRTPVSKKPQDIKYVSLEERTQPRVKFVEIKVESLGSNGFVVRLELEQRAGRTMVTSLEGSGAASAEVRCAATATIEGLLRLTGAGQGALRLVNLRPVKVFNTPAVAVSLEGVVEGVVQQMVGFCVMEMESPARAAALAVLNGVNRFLGGVDVRDGAFEWRAPRLRRGSEKPVASDPSQ